MGSRVLALPIFGVVALVFAPAVQNGFVFLDDPFTLLENPWIGAGVTWGNVQHAFVSNDVANWHPLTWLSHMLDVELYGLDRAAAAPGHHATSVLLHALAAALLFVALVEAPALARLGDARAPWVAGFGALAFALHPLRVESVAWVSERKDVLCALFWALALVCEGRVARAEQSGASTRGPRVAVFVAFVCALLSKPMAVTLPFTLLLFDVWPLERRRELASCTRRFAALFVEKIPLFVLVPFAAALNLWAQGRFMPTEARSLVERAGDGAFAILRYLWLEVAPAPLTHVHAAHLERPTFVVGLLAWVIVAALVAVAVAALAWRRGPQGVAVGWLWFAGALVPVCGFVQVGAQAINDRYTYVPSIGVTLAILAVVVLAFERAPERMKRAWIAAVLVLAGWTLVTERQIPVWRNDGALLWNAAIAQPDDPEAQLDLVRFLGNVGDFESAFERAIVLDQLAPQAQYADLVGQTLLHLERPKDALVSFDLARARDATHVLSRVHRAETLEALGRAEEAEAAWSEVLALPPTRRALEGRAGSLERRGRTEEADEMRERARALPVVPDPLQMTGERGLFPSTR